MSGFPLDPLCTPIRFVTQLLWMGLRERQSGRGRDRELESARWVGAALKKCREKTRMRVRAIEKENESKGKGGGK